MAKVSMHLGFTFRVGDLATNQYGRIDMNIDQIDTELPLDKQLDDSKRTADGMWKYIRESIDDKIDDMLNEAGG
tara:strand:+ start:97 stop:318 length:222 start_codon:yes stop_codon:yes gene_type:complete